MVPGDTSPFHPSLFQNHGENGRRPPFTSPFLPQDFHGLMLNRSMSFSEEMQVEDEMSDHDGGGALGEKKKRLSKDQVRGLEKSYELGSKLDQERKEKISRALGLSQRQVAIWFQNRRARGKTKQIEKDYQLLLKEFEIIKADNDLLRTKNEQFQSQLMALRRQKDAMNRENAASSWSPVDVNLGITAGTSSGMLFSSGMEQAAAVVAPPHPHHLLQGSVGDQANMFGSGHDEVPEQTTFWAWPDQHNFR